ncbi:MAG: hypothetical protein ACMVY4_01730 [Minwuia sp.]|uniref:hypothetical protein n=1 Tax=Minwuia sp. TaxID=2493630 RepID=UPI003A83E7F0
MFSVSEDKIMTKYPTSSAILEELSQIVVESIRDNSPNKFSGNLREFIDFHSFLIQSHRFVDEEGVIRSLSLLGGWFSEHQDWIRAYNEMTIESVKRVPYQSEYFSSICRVLPVLFRNYIGSEQDTSWKSLFDLAIRLGYQATDSNTDYSERTGSVLDASASRDFIGAWESLGTEIVSPIRRSDRNQDSAPANWKAIYSTFPILRGYFETWCFFLCLSFYKNQPALYDALQEHISNLDDNFEYNFSSHNYYRNPHFSVANISSDWDKTIAKLQPILDTLYHIPMDPRLLSGIVFSNLWRDFVIVASVVCVSWTLRSNNTGEKTSLEQINNTISAVAKSNFFARDGSRSAFSEILIGAIRGMLRGEQHEHLQSPWDSVEKIERINEPDRITGRIYTSISRSGVNDYTEEILFLLIANFDERECDRTFRLVVGMLPDVSEPHYFRSVIANFKRSADGILSSTSPISQKIHGELIRQDLVTNEYTITTSAEYISQKFEELADSAREFFELNSKFDG